MAIKLKITNEFDIESYLKDYSKLKRIAYNHLIDGKSLTETQKLIKFNIKHCLDASFVEYASLDAEQIKNSTLNRKIIFGGKKNLKKLIDKKITKDDWKKLRSPYIYSIGRANENFGNRKFKIDFAQNNCFYFCPNRNTKIELKVFASKNQSEMLNKIEEMSINRRLAITYKLTRTHIILSIDETKLSETSYQPVKNRILSLDLNPNSIGLVISDFNNQNDQTIIFKQIYNLYKLNKKDKNKNHYENFQIVKSIIKLCNYYKIESVGIEKLEIESKDNQKGKNFNKSVNKDWIRNKFINNLKKHCNLNNIRIYEIAAAYSSFIGCILNDKEIDSVAAAIEIGRRANLFINIFIKNNLPRDTKIVFPEWNIHLMNRWKKDLDVSDISDWKTMFRWFKKNSTLSYRNLLSGVDSSHFLRFLHRKSYVFLYKN